jgi:hypothetical protein
MEAARLSGALSRVLDPLARDKLSRVLIHDQADRDAIASDPNRSTFSRVDDWTRFEKAMLWILFVALAVLFAWLTFAFMGRPTEVAQIHGGAVTTRRVL